jgi:hypothetical protein
MEVSLMPTSRTARALALASLLLAPAAAEAGSPLICFPFQTGSAEVLPWTFGQGWKTPDPTYDVRQLTADTLRLLSPTAPVLARMENMRRAAIYASQAPGLADELLTALLARTRTPNPDPLALFDAGYFIETLRHGSYMRLNHAQAADGYALVVRALGLAGLNPEMEFAASLMTGGSRAAEHRRRAQAGAGTNRWLALTMSSFGG